MSDLLGGIIDAAKYLLGGGAVLGVLKGVRYAFSFTEGDIPVCNTRVVRTGRGFVWNRQVGLHPMQDGRLEITPIDLPKP